MQPKRFGAISPTPARKVLNFASRFIRWTLTTGSLPPMRAIRSGTMSGLMASSMILKIAAFSFGSQS